MPNTTPAPPDPSRPTQPSVANFLHVLGAVFASFLGIRKKASGEKDMQEIKPQQVIVAGLLGAALFVTVLVLLVRFITRGV
jgi:Protein of unknown function (DUF2970)